MRAEIIPDCPPLWHILATAPGNEHKAMAHLALRGFGVYRPQYSALRYAGKNVRIRRLDLFPHHVFLLVWDLIRHLRSILSCPGVVSVLSADERPITIPRSDIHRMRIIEFADVCVTDLGEIRHARTTQRRRRRRPRRGKTRNKLDRRNVAEINTAC